jgi:alanine-alpha-ketoisovalerate/valine-pyruvate aminotransferase
MRFPFLLLIFALAVCGSPAVIPTGNAREFLTDEEIKKIQEAQDINRRVRIYMEAAEYRLKTAQERLSGVESVEGDPLEFFTPEEMVDGYYSIVQSVMLNLDGAYQQPAPDLNKIKSGLKTLKKGAEKAGRQLEMLKIIAEDQKKEGFWNLVNKAIEITDGAHEGAVYGMEEIDKLSDRNRRSH